MAEHVDEVAEKEVVAPTKRRGKRKHLPADLPRIEIIHELPEHELTCACGCRKHAIAEEISEQLEIVPMQIRVICSYVGEQSVANGGRGFQVAGLDAYAVQDEMAGRIRLNIRGRLRIKACPLLTEKFLVGFGSSRLAESDYSKVTVEGKRT